jgi:hypothetical protein
LTVKIHRANAAPVPSPSLNPSNNDGGIKAVVIEAYVLVLVLATDEQRLNNLLMVGIMLPQLMLQQ